jgi:hypothetical protein
LHNPTAENNETEPIAVIIKLHIPRI